MIRILTLWGAALLVAGCSSSSDGASTDGGSADATPPEIICFDAGCCRRNFAARADEKCLDQRSYICEQAGKPESVGECHRATCECSLSENEFCCTVPK